MARTSLPTKDGGRIDFGIDEPLRAWFAMVFERGADIPRVYSPSCDRGRVVDLLLMHVEDSPERQEALTLVALGLDPGRYPPEEDTTAQERFVLEHGEEPP